MLRICSSCSKSIFVFLFLVAIGLALSAEIATSEYLSFERDALYGYARTFQVSLGDLDGDGDLDAVFANIPARSEVWMNDGTGRFTNAYKNIGDKARGMGIGDLDGDGDLDLLMSPASSSDPSRVYLNDGSGGFTVAAQDLGDTAIPANCMSLFDVEGDGDLDAGIYYPLSQRQTRLYLNDGTGHFTTSTDLRLPGIATWGDVDGDGDMDAVCLQHEQTGRGYKVFLNDGTNVFQESQHIATPGLFIVKGTAMGDLDRDGDLDVVANGGEGDESPLTVLLNDGMGVFSLAPASDFACPSGRIALGDFNDDGAIDVFISCGEQPMMIGLGDGTGGFVDSGLKLGSSGMSGVPAVGDLDGDGDLDIFTSGYGHDGFPNEVWLNGMR
ncbi:MAG: VCBS repeat-containing protein [Dehalococcoidia bacterium]|nr:VCBS repeat-containing protein [Dehalococcoidia bacterium]